jgi:hypothetical protein
LPGQSRSAIRVSAPPAAAFVLDGAPSREGFCPDAARCALLSPVRGPPECVGACVGGGADWPVVESPADRAARRSAVRQAVVGPGVPLSVHALIGPGGDSRRAILRRQREYERLMGRGGGMAGAAAARAEARAEERAEARVAVRGCAEEVASFVSDGFAGAVYAQVVSDAEAEFSSDEGVGEAGSGVSESDRGSSAPGDSWELGECVEGTEYCGSRLGWLPVGTVVVWSDVHVHVRLYRDGCGMARCGVDAAGFALQRIVYCTRVGLEVRGTARAILPGGVVYASGVSE